MVEGSRLADLESAQFRSAVELITNTASGRHAQVCTEVKGKRAYLIVVALRGCEDERKIQTSNG